MTMSIELLLSFLGWCALINYVIFMIWWLVFVFAHGWLYELHDEWFNLTERDFDNIHYLCMGLYKLGIFFFLLVPYLVLRFLA